MRFGKSIPINFKGVRDGEEASLTDILPRAQAERTVRLMTQSTALKTSHVQVVVLRLVSKVIGGQLQVLCMVQCGMETALSHPHIIRC